MNSTTDQVCEKAVDTRWCATHQKPWGHDEDMEQRLDSAIQKGLAAFWSEFAGEFPEAEFGDMEPGAVDPLEDAAEAVGRIWVESNVPGVLVEG